MQSRVYTYPNAIVRVHYPDITQEENERRHKKIRESAEKLLREVLKAQYAREAKERISQNDTTRNDT